MKKMIINQFLYQIDEFKNIVYNMKLK